MKPVTDLILLPCPFCGGDAQIDYCDSPGYHSETIACSVCEARVKPCSNYGKREIVATRWNTRTEVTEPKECTIKLLDVSRILE